MMKVLSVLLFVLQWNIAFAEEYVITRQSRDKFEIPNHGCTSALWEHKCDKMNGRIQSTSRKCFCSCTKDYRQNVFGFFDDKWQCAKNTDVRNKYSECYDFRINLNDKKDDEPLLVARKSKQLRGTFRDNSASKCHLVDTMSYLDCNSVWKSVAQHSSVGFYSTFSYWRSVFRLYDKGRNAFKKYSPKIDGYIIKLDVRCENYWSSWYYCILLKVKGNLNCTIKLPTTSPPTSTSTPTTKATSTAAASPSTKESSSSQHSTTTTSATTSSSTQSTTSSSLTPSTSNEFITLFIPKLSSKALSPKTVIPIITTQISIHQNSTNSPLKGGDGETADQSAIIAGPIVGVTALITIVIILIFIRVWMKRNKREASEGIAQNPVYDGVVPSNSSERPGQQTSADDEYSYAYTNTHPVVIRDQNGKVLQGQNFSNGHNGNIKVPTTSPSSSDIAIYNTLDGTNHAELSKTKDTNSGPSYNVLERRPEANWNKQKGPLSDVPENTNSGSGTLANFEAPIYNTLEDPDYAKLEKSDVRIGSSYDILEGPKDKQAMAQGSSFYDILENPNSTGTPVYDVLEEPELDEQHVYGSLQNNDPHIYGALQSPTSNNGEANSEYDDDYNFAGEVIHDDVDRNVYQELNQDRQRSSDDVYEPLHHSRELIDMKDMNEESQSHA